MAKNYERDEREEYWRRPQQNRESQERWSTSGREDDYGWGTQGQEGRLAPQRRVRAPSLAGNERPQTRPG